MSIERKNPLKRDQALNDATSGQLGDEPGSQPMTKPEYNIEDARTKTARKFSRNIDNNLPT